MVVVLGIDPGTAHTGYGVVLSRGQHARRARRRRDRDAARRAARAAAGPHPRARLRPDRRAPPGRRGGRGALLRPERAHAPSPSARRAAWCCCRRAWPASPASPTRRRRSSRRCAAAAAPTRTRCSAWSARCCRCPSRPSPTTPPTPSPWPSATPTARRCWRRLPVVIASVRGEVVVAAARPRGHRGRRRRLPAGGLRRDARAVPARGRGGAAAHAPRHARRRHPALRLRHRGGARAVPDADRRAGRGAEGGAGRALAAARRASC